MSKEKALNNKQNLCYVNVRASSKLSDGAENQIAVLVAQQHLVSGVGDSVGSKRAGQKGHLPSVLLDNGVKGARDSSARVSDSRVLQSGGVLLLDLNTAVTTNNEL